MEAILIINRKAMKTLTRESIIEVLKKRSVFTDGGNIKKELAVFEEQFYYVANEIIALQQPKPSDQKTFKSISYGRKDQTVN